MNTLMEIEEEKEAKLESAKIGYGFYSIIDGQRSTASAERIDAVRDSRLRAAQEAPDGRNPERPQAGS